MWAAHAGSAALLTSPNSHLNHLSPKAQQLCSLQGFTARQDGDNDSLGSCEGSGAGVWWGQRQYLVVQVEEVGVLLTDIGLGVGDQLPNVPVGTGQAQ